MFYCLGETFINLPNKVNKNTNPLNKKPKWKTFTVEPESGFYCY